MNKWIGTLVVVLLAMASGGWQLATEVSAAKQKVLSLEERIREDRKDNREALNEVKEHVKAIDGNTQIILQTIKAMDAVQKSERRRDR